MLYKLSACLIVFFSASLSRTHSHSFSVCLYGSLSVSSSVSQSLLVFLSPSVCLFLFLPVYFSVCLFLCLSHWSIIKAYSLVKRNNSFNLYSFPLLLINIFDSYKYCISCLSTYLSIFYHIYLSIYLSIYLLSYESIYLSVYLSIYLSIFYRTNLSIYLLIDLSIAWIYLSICASMYLSCTLTLCLGAWANQLNVNNWVMIDWIIFFLNVTYLKE